MFKSKVKTAFILFIILIISSTFVFAADDTSDAEVISIDADNSTSDVEATTSDVDDSISDTETTQTTTQSDIHEGDMYVFEDDAVIDKIVDGNLFVFANNVTIKTQVGGDVFVMANKVTIDALDMTTGTGGYIYNNVFVFANEVVVNGVVYDLYAASNTLTIGENGYVYRDLRFGGSTVNVYGAVGRNAYVECNNISFGDSDNTGIVYGNFEYTSSNLANIPDDAVQGEVKFTDHKISTKSNKDVVLDYVSNLLSALVFTLVVALFVNLISNKFTNSASAKGNVLRNNFLLVLGLGIAGLIVLPIIFVVLLATVLGAKVALVLLVVYLLFIALSTSMFDITVTDLVTGKFNIDTKPKKYLALAVVTALVWLLTQVPYVGIFVSFLASVLGFGIILVKLFGKATSKADSKIDENKTEEE